MHSRTLPYLLIAPAIVFLLVFFVYPFLLVAWQAFATDEGVLTTKYFSKMVKHWKFDKALTNTFLVVLAIVPVQLVLSLLMASMVSTMRRGRDTILYIWTIPLGISDLAAGLIWLAIFNQTGFLNSFLHTLGFIDQPLTLLGYQNKGTIFLAVMLAEVWRATAIMLVILVAGIGLIPKDILRVILAFEVFAVVAALGGTNLKVLMGEVYDWQFLLQDSHIAASYAMLILLISVAFTLFFMWALRTPKEAQI